MAVIAYMDCGFLEVRNSVRCREWYKIRSEKTNEEDSRGHYKEFRFYFE